MHQERSRFRRKAEIETAVREHYGLQGDVVEIPGAAPAEESSEEAPENFFDGETEE